MTRNEVSKKVRFEVLRRDGFRCRYCGAKAPDVQLRVDHVIPWILGGTNQPTNLVTACFDCNAGKADTDLDSPVADDVAVASWRWAEALTLVAAERRRRRESLDDDLAWFREVWTGWILEGHPLPLPDGWDTAVTDLIVAGAEVEDLAELVPLAMRARYGSVQRRDRHCHWKKFHTLAHECLRRIHAHTGHLAAVPPDPDLANLDLEAYRAGHTTGYEAGYHDGWETGVRAGGRVHRPRQDAPMLIADLLTPDRLETST